MVAARSLPSGPPWTTEGVPTHRRRRPTRRLQATASAPPPPAQPPPAEEPEAAILLAACAVGLATGAGVVAFNWAIDAVRAGAWAGTPLEATHWGAWARALPLSASAPLLVLPPVLGGVAVGALRAGVGGSLDEPRLPRWLTTMEGGGGEEGAEGGDVGGRHGGPPPPSSTAAAAAAAAIAGPILRAAAAAIGLGAGVSLGPEGPSVDIGKAAARGAGAVLLVRARARAALPLLAAGAGAGVAAGFNAPISGVVFALETVFLRPAAAAADEKNAPLALGAQLQPPPPPTTPGLAIAAVLLATVLAALVSQAGLGDTPAFRVPVGAAAPALVELPLALGLGALCGGLAIAYSAAERAAAAAFTALETTCSVPPPALPALAGLVTGGLALAAPEVLYQGFGNVNAILEADPGEYTPLLLLGVVAAKVAATATCRGGRLVGGLYAPSILMGAALGAAVAGAAGAAGVGGLAGPQAYALTGAAGMLAATCGVPLTAALLVFELTRDYMTVVPTLGAAGVAAWVAGGGLAGAAGGVLLGGQQGGVAEVGAAAPPAVPPAPLPPPPSPAPPAAVGARLAAATARAEGTTPPVPFVGAAPAVSPPPPSPPTPSSPTALCAAGEGGCLVLPASTPLTKAVAALEEEAAAGPPGVSVAAVLLKEGGGVAGVLTLERARAALVDARAAAAAEGGGVKASVSAAAAVPGAGEDAE